MEKNDENIKNIYYLGQLFPMISKKVLNIDNFQGIVSEREISVS